MRFDARDLAHAWLAVANASGVDKDDRLTFKTIAIEEISGETATLGADV